MNQPANRFPRAKSNRVYLKSTPPTCPKCGSQLHFHRTDSQTSEDFMVLLQCTKCPWRETSGQGCDPDVFYHQWPESVANFMREYQ